MTARTRVAVKVVVGFVRRVLRFRGMRATIDQGDFSDEMPIRKVEVHRVFELYCGDWLSAIRANGEEIIESDV